MSEKHVIEFAGQKEEFDTIPELNARLESLFLLGPTNITAIRLGHFKASLHWSGTEELDNPKWDRGEGLESPALKEPETEELP
jgi:hypothetical protein